MSALLPSQNRRLETRRPERSVLERERALLAELEALKAENEHLRCCYAQALGRQAAATASRVHQTTEVGGPSLPLPLDAALGADGAAASPHTSRLEYEALFGALASVFPIGVFRTDHTGVLTHVDEQLQRLFALERQDFPNFGWLHRVHPDDLERVQQHWVQALSSGESQSVEFRLVRPGNDVSHVLVRNAPLRDAQGAITSQLGFVQDITPMRALEAEARIKDQLNRQIIASNPDRTKVLDLQGRKLPMAGPGETAGEAERADWTAGWPEDGARLAREAIDGAREGRSTRFVARSTAPDGAPKWWDTVVTPICDAQGRPVMLLAVSRDITALHQQQEEIQRFNAELEQRVRERTEELGEAKERIALALRDAQTLYNKAPCGYHSVDASGIFVQMNRTELDWLGYEREDVIGRLSFRDVIVPNEPPDGEDLLQRLIRDGKLESIETRVRRRDGSTFPALVSSTAVFDRQGRFVRSNTTVIDITERKAAEMALRDNQRFLRAITDHIPGLVAYVDAGLVYRFANAEHLRVFGQDPCWLVGRHASEVLSPEVWADAQPRMEAALSGLPQHFETSRRKTDGQDVFLSVTYLPDVREGRIKGLFVQTIDITERKRVEERVMHLNEELEQRVRDRSNALLESEQRFRLMVDNLRDYCIFFLDADGIITDWTDSAQRMSGHPASQMEGRHYGFLLDPLVPEQGKARANQMLRLAASRGQHEQHDWNTRKDGTRFWSHSVLIALRDNSGELRGYAKINRDMTEAKRIDDLMRNINDELENRVVERTEQLLAANKDLESFSYSVSHDLRSPLRHISSFVSLLEEHLADRCDEVSARYLSTIGNSARHMSQLIDGLLAFSRLGRAAVNLTPVDLTLLVDTVVSHLGHDTEGRVVDWVIAPDLPVVQGDALLLREVWANLLGNAYKYTRPRERARIEVGWSVDPVEGYTFFVRDNGVGFDTKYAQKLFGVFQRLHRAAEFEGTGIGLALTRRIIERHGGSIWAESKLGEGSTFYFSLPFESPYGLEAAPIDSMPAALES